MRHERHQNMLSHMRAFLSRNSSFATFRFRSIRLLPVLLLTRPPPPAL